MPVVVAAHSCVATWWARGEGQPTAAGLALAEAADRARPRAGRRGAWCRRASHGDALIAGCTARSHSTRVVPNGGRAMRPCRRKSRSCWRPGVGGTRQECRHAGCGRGTGALAVRLAGALDGPERRRPSAAACTGAGRCRAAARERDDGRAAVFVSRRRVRAVRPRRAGGGRVGCGAGAVRHPDLPRAVGRRSTVRAAGRRCWLRRA